MQVKHSVVHGKVTQVALPNVACCRAAVVNNNDPCFFFGIIYESIAGKIVDRGCYEELL